MSLASAMAPVADAYRNEVFRDTWGHTAATPGIIYAAVIVYTRTEWDEFVPIKSDIELLSEGPWQAEHVSDFVYRDGQKRTVGGVFRFVGTYQVYKTGRPLFKGKTTRLL